MDHEKIIREKLQVEIAKSIAEIGETRQRIDESIAQTAKIKKEIKWYEVVIISGATLAIVAVAKLFL